jgi:hypothetical protein
MARPYNPLLPLTPRQQRAEALALLKAALLPERQGIKRARLQARQESEAAQRRMEGLSKGLAALQRDIAPQTLQGYQGAAQTQGALAQGFTGAMRSSAEADARAAGELLSRLGAPSSQISQVQGVGQGAADQAYALGGYIPGQSLASQGAAFSAAQRQLPATTLGRGQQQIGQLERARMEREKELDAQLADLEAKAPGSLAQILQQIRQNEQAKVATRIQGEYLGLAGDKFGLDTRATVADITGVDPATGLPTADATAAANKTKGKNAKARVAATKAREVAFKSARQDVLSLARTLAQGEKTDEIDPRTLEPKVIKPNWGRVRQQLWTEIGPDLLRFASGSGKNALKRRIYKMIDQAMLAAGMRRAPGKPKPRRSKNRGPGDDRPG